MTLEDTLRQIVREELAAGLERIAANTNRSDLIYLTTKEASEVLRCHPETVRKLVTAGKLPRREINGDLRFARADLDNLLGARTGNESAEQIVARLLRTA